MTELQQHIIEQLNVQPIIEPKQEIQKRVDFLKSFLKKSGAKGFVLGISGGQDSALAGKLAQIAVEQLNAELAGLKWTPTLWHGDVTPEVYNQYAIYKLKALYLPYGEQRDIKDAVTVVEDFIFPDSVESFNIKDTVDAFKGTYENLALLNPHSGRRLQDYHKGNVKARVRMTTQYAYAGELGYLVIGTDHAAEAVSGFFTKGGDGQADLLPLSGLSKRQGKSLLRELNAPEIVITKAPTADLLDNKSGQRDETELGITYEEIDDYLEGKTIPVSSSDIIENRYLATMHKRQAPVALSDTWWK